jgi:hypothetical protein
LNGQFSRVGREDTLAFVRVRDYEGLLSLELYCYRHYQALFGVAHASGSGFGVSNTSNAFAGSLSGGVAVKLFHRWSLVFHAA